MKKAALLMMIVLLGTNIYAEQISIGVKLGGAGTSVHLTEGSFHSYFGDIDFEREDVGFSAGGELFLNMYFNHFFAVQTGLTFNQFYSVYVTNNRFRVNGGSWERELDYQFNITSIGIDLLAFFTLPSSFYISFGPNVGVSILRAEDTTQNFIDIAGVVEFGVVSSVGSGTLIVGLRNRIGLATTGDAFIEVEGVEGIFSIERFIGEFINLRIGYIINLN
ncbi:MAG: hypothetical protein FWE37_00350 [Spirochaetaceae bacterium]|nr:hypothetical protein [Spirochaetaceae bacterium]